MKNKRKHGRCDGYGPESCKDSIKEVIEEGLGVKAVGCCEIPVGVWKSQGDRAVELWTGLFITMVQRERKPEEQRRRRRRKMCRCVAITRKLFC